MLGKLKLRFPWMMLPAFLIAGCAPSYTADTYAGGATQKANKVDQGVIVGVRAVRISADTALGTATGAAAGGIAGSQVGGGGAVTALGALGGTVAGGVVGDMVSHAAGDTDGFEYIVKKPNGDLLSVTQEDAAPLAIGAHVLIIEGAQARVVPDYTVPLAVAPSQADGAKPEAGDSHSPDGAMAGKAPEPASRGITATPLPPPDAPGSGKTPDAQPVLAPPNSI